MVVFNSFFSLLGVKQYRKERPGVVMVGTIVRRVQKWLGVMVGKKSLGVVRSHGREYCKKSPEVVRSHGRQEESRSC